MESPWSSEASQGELFSEQRSRRFLSVRRDRGVFSVSADPTVPLFYRRWAVVLTPSSQSLLGLLSPFRQM